jgi:hypothetical protein
MLSGEQRDLYRGEGERGRSYEPSSDETVDTRGLRQNDRRWDLCAG